MADNRKSTIQDTRYIVVVLTAEEKAAYLSVECTIEAHAQWWFDKLSKMGCWVTEVILAIRIEENRGWDNGYKLSYK